MTVLDMIKKQFSKYDNLDADWVQFIKDHRANIIANSIRHEPSAIYQNPYEYNLIAYLRSIQFDVTAAWIVKYINNLDTDKDFKDISYIYVPNIKQLQELFKVYQTRMAVEKSL